MSWFEVFEKIAIVVMLFVYIPQAVKLRMSKDTEGLSVSSYIIMFWVTMMLMVHHGIGSETDLNFLITYIAVGLIQLYIVYHIFKNIGNKTLFWINFGAFVLFAAGGITLAAIDVHEEDWSKTVGLVTISLAGLGAATAFAPQSIRSIRTKEVENVSLITPALIVLEKVLTVGFYIGTLIHKSEEGSQEWAINIVGIVSGLIAIGWELPIIYQKLKLEKSSAIRNML